MGLIASFGKYLLFVTDAFKKPERRSVMYRLVIQEIYDLGLKSLSFVMFVSLFVGAVVALQTAANLEGSLIFLNFLIFFGSKPCQHASPLLANFFHGNFSPGSFFRSGDISE